MLFSYAGVTMFVENLIFRFGLSNEWDLNV